MRLVYDEVSMQQAVDHCADELGDDTTESVTVQVQFVMLERFLGEVAAHGYAAEVQDEKRPTTMPKVKVSREELPLAG